MGHWLGLIMNILLVVAQSEHKQARTVGLQASAASNR